MLGTQNRDRLAERRKATQREILAAAWDLARENGLSQITLRDVAARVGMQAPSLYSHYASKNAIYDAMFEQAWTDCHEAMSAMQDELAESPRAKLRLYACTFFRFAAADLARHQLMNQRTIPGFEPSIAGYAPALAVTEELRERLRLMGIIHDEDVDLYTALVGGLLDAQFANDPGGNRWARLVDRAVDMFADNVGIPREV